MFAPCYWYKLMVNMAALQVCADTMVGNQMIRGVSGGQKKRITTGRPAIASPAVWIRNEQALPFS